MQVLLARVSLVGEGGHLREAGDQRTGMTGQQSEAS
jgi:hypothetical protein